MRLKRAILLPHHDLRLLVSIRLHPPPPSSASSRSSQSASSLDGCSSDEGFRFRDKQAFRKQKLKIVCGASGEKLCLILMSSFLHWERRGHVFILLPHDHRQWAVRITRRRSERNQNEQLYVVLCLVERG